MYLSECPALLSLQALPFNHLLIPRETGREWDLWEQRVKTQRQSLKIRLRMNKREALKEKNFSSLCLGGL